MDEKNTYPRTTRHTILDKKKADNNARRWMKNPFGFYFRCKSTNNI